MDVGRGLLSIKKALHVIALLRLTAYLYPQQADLKGGESFDYIIVGAGSAGCVLANRLTEDPNVSVLLIEAGGDPPIESNLPSLQTLQIGTYLDWQYSTSGSDYKCYDNHINKIARGKLLGGSSSINLMYHVRGDPHDYNTWAQMTNDQSWNYENVLPYFKKSERFNDSTILNSPTGSFHGTKGPLGVTLRSFAGQDDLLGAMEELGYNINPDPNSNYSLGYSVPQVNVADGIRQSTANTYLSVAKDRKNLYVLKNTLATKIHFTDKVAKSVDTENNKGVKRTFLVKKEIIVSAGAINSPQLLMLSGIGPRKHLTDLGIDVVADLPVGRNLQDHKQVLLAFTLGKPDSKPKPVNPHEHPLNLLFGYVALNKSQTYADYQIAMSANQSSAFFNACSYNLSYKSNICKHFYDQSKGRNILFGALFNMHPKSRGYIELKSRNPKVYPHIITEPFANKDDLEDLIKYVEDYTRIVNSTYLKSFNAKMLELEQCVQFGVGTTEYWRCYVQCIISSSWHLCGSCGMGASGTSGPYDSVVDSRLRVHGIQGLRVADASIMPIVPSGNTNAPTVMIGEKAADMIKQDNA